MAQHLRDKERRLLLSLRPAWSIQWVPGQSGICRESVSRRKEEKVFIATKPRFHLPQLNLSKRITANGKLYSKHPNALQLDCRGNRAAECLAPIHDALGWLTMEDGERGEGREVWKGKGGEGKWTKQNTSTKMSMPVIPALQR